MKKDLNEVIGERRSGAAMPPRMETSAAAWSGIHLRALSGFISQVDLRGVSVEDL